MTQNKSANEIRPFVFVSHASVDKESGKFREVVKTLLAHGVPLGLDHPHNIGDPDINPDTFLWSLGPDGSNVGAAIARALGQGACAALFLLSRNTPDGNDEQQKTSYLWREMLAAQAVRESCACRRGVRMLLSSAG
jgi:hypothetical protein